MFVLIKFLFGLGFCVATFWEKSCSLGLPYVLIVLCLFVILVIFRFGFKVEIWVVFATVPGHC